MSVESGTGVVAGRYAIQSELARGGMGVVFRVLDRSTGRALALKRSLPDEPAAAVRNAALLEREYRTLVTLRHPRIIQVYDFGIDAEGAFYTMELLDGDDLRARSPLNWKELCSNLRDVASSLALLHSRRLLHRDVSASNIRLTSEGRAKLIDFGTLVSFGRTNLLAGTPSGVAPEAVEGSDLDGRVDLFALGATAYYALTKSHAYPARTLRDLHSVWARGTPTRPSEISPGIPAELDELVLSLLALDRTRRPSSAAEVIDRLGAIAALPPEADDRVAQSYLVGPDLIGRERALARLGARLRRAAGGQGSTLLIEGAAGLGRSALLTRFESDARVSGALVLHVDARARVRPFGTCQSLVQRAIAELPDRAASLASAHLQGLGEHFQGIGTLRGERAERGGAGDAPSAEATEALTLFFSKLAEVAPLVFLVDNGHVADSQSLPVFAALGRAARTSRILLVIALDTDDSARTQATLAMLRRGSARIRLRPFTADQTEHFVRASFGEAPATKSLASWLHAQSTGVPSLAAELVSQLVKTGKIYYAEGIWVLPQELPKADVLAVLAASTRERISRLTPPERRLAECLSPHRRWLDAELCRALGARDPELAAANCDALLEKLVRDGVLVGDHAGYAFAQPAMREILYSDLDENEKKLLHRHAALTLAARSNGDPEKEFERGWHLLLAGDREGAAERITLCMEEVVSRPDALVRVIPELRDLYREYRRIGGTPDEFWVITASLVISGYYVDPTAHDEFGDDTARWLQRRTGLALAAQVPPWLGSHVGLGVGLSWGLTQNVWPSRSMRIDQFGSMVLAFVGVCAARSAVGYLRLEPNTHALLQDLLAPAAGLGKHNALCLVYDLFSIALSECAGDFAGAFDGYHDQLERLPHVRFFIEEGRHHYEAALLCSLGRCHLMRAGDGALSCATRVDAMGGEHDRLLAQFLRRSHHLFRGEIAAAKDAEEVFDGMAAQCGYRWVPDVLSVMDLVPYHLSGDVLGLKRVLHRTERILRIAPAYTVHCEVIRAMHEGHRGRPERALAIYETVWERLSPFHHPIWSFAHAHRAECLNSLGRHEEALAICRPALERVGDLARVYVVAYQQLEREAAIAEAHLGRPAASAHLLDGLIASASSDPHPLALGLLHRDRARVARLENDREAFDHHCAKTQAVFGRTGNAILLSAARRLRDLWPDQTERDPSEDEPHGSDALLNSVAGAPLHVLADRALSHMVELAGAAGGCLYLMQNGAPVLSARHGSHPETNLDTPVRRLLAPYGDGSEAKTELTSRLRVPESDVPGVRLLPLLAMKAGRDDPVGVAALFGCRTPEALTARHLRELSTALRASVVTAVDAGSPRAQRTFG